MVAVRESIVFMLDPRSGVPAYLQLVHQVKRSITYGHLRQGDRLPAVRDVARQVAINPNTVLKAYGELEHEGLIESTAGRGTFVSSEAPKPLASRVQEPLRRGFRTWLRNARRAGLDREDILALVHLELEEKRERVA
jgi:DNA-binding transcriptional regulator YhcF (GntR family)